jgi:hypothetical protein
MQKHLLKEYNILKSFSVRQFINISDQINENSSQEEIENAINNHLKNNDLDNIPGSIELTVQEKRSNFLLLLIDNVLKYCIMNNIHTKEMTLIVSMLIKSYNIDLNEIRKLIK